MFQQVFVNNRGGQTKILVTHALHFLPQVDYVYTIADGQIKERGTYTELMAHDGVFSRFVREFGSKGGEGGNYDQIADEVEEGKEGKSGQGARAHATLKEQDGKDTTIMQDEERNVGSVTWQVYKEYLLAGNGYFLAPLLLLVLVLLQGSQIMSSYWLVYWQENQFHKPAGFYVRGPPLFSSYSDTVLIC